MTSIPYFSGSIRPVRIAKAQGPRAARAAAPTPAPAPASTIGGNMVSEILFITTTDAGGGRGGDLERLLSSIGGALGGREWRMLLLVQRASSRADIAIGTPANVDVGIIPNRVSASRARNILLREARER
ncbi:MAG: hypothetical protein AB7F74_15300, partial [Parvibaculaceae bacterium]